MAIRDLSKMELLALVGLMESVLMADNFLSDDEEAQVHALIAEVGAERYEELIDEFDAEYGDEMDFRSLLESVTRQEARELLYGTILSVANANTLMGQSSDLLAWLMDEWEIDVQIEDEEE
jgi:uncharacterized tellurite resistance protein B-like protein